VRAKAREGSGFGFYAKIHIICVMPLSRKLVTYGVNGRLQIGLRRWGKGPDNSRKFYINTYL